MRAAIDNLNDPGAESPVPFHGYGAFRFGADTLVVLDRGDAVGLRQLIADKDYNSRKFRQSLRTRGILPCIPPKCRPQNWKRRQGRPVKQYTEEYRQRWPVEPGALRAGFAWLGHQRGLLVWHEAKSENFHTFCALACIRLALMAAVQCAPLY
jgi:hypothetical protein